MKEFRPELGAGKPNAEAKSEENVSFCSSVHLSSVQLFDHIATCLSEFLDSQELKGQTLPLGFTFSFPCEQKEIDKVSRLNTTNTQQFVQQLDQNH